MADTPSRQQALADTLFAFGVAVNAVSLMAHPMAMRQRSEELAALLCRWLENDRSSVVVAECDRALAEISQLRDRLAVIRWYARTVRKALAAAEGCYDMPAAVFTMLRSIDPVGGPDRPPEPIYVVFDGPPGPESGRFIETEDGAGRGVGHAEVKWRQRADGYWTLGPFVAAHDVGLEHREVAGE